VVARALVLFAVLTAGGAAARAQDEEPSSQARSKALYDQGSRAYKAGDYPRAVELFLAAYDLSHVPAILFNVAQAHRLAGDCERALEYYRRSLDEEPGAANRAEVEERIEEMKRCADQRAAAPDEGAGAVAGDAPGPAAAPETDRESAAPPAGLTGQARDQPPPSRRSLLPMVTVGVGAAAALAGGIIYLQARSKFDQVEASCPCEPGSFSGWEAATDTSYVLMGAGAVVAGAGLIWWWRQSHRAPRRIGLVPTARGVAWAGWF